MSFKKEEEYRDESFMTPPNLFEITLPFISNKMSHFVLNEIKSKYFLKKFHKFTNNSLGTTLVWKTKLFDPCFI